MAETPVLICDLDGTLLAGNSYHLLLQEILRPGAVRSVGLGLPLRVAGTLARRVAWRVDRVEMKQAVHAHLNVLSEDRRRALARRVSAAMASRLRPDVAEAVQLARRLGCTAVLATAAFHEHATELVEGMGFDHVVATTWPTGGEAWIERSGLAKLQAVRSVVGDRRPWVLLSDHEDDEPLADECDRVFWVHRRSEPRPGRAQESPFDLRCFERWCGNRAPIRQPPT